jgi:hypothetical protein
MEPNFVVGNMMWNAALVGGLGYMIRLWMKDTKEKLSIYCNQNREDHKDVYEKLDEHGQRITALEVMVENK